MSESVKTQLSASMISSLFKCGIQVQRRYGLDLGIGDRNEIIAPGIASAIGSSTHEVVAENLKHKMKHKALLPREEFIDLARDTWNMYYPEVMLTEEQAANDKKTRGESTDKAIALAGTHYDLIAPKLNPITVEETFVIELPNYPFDLKGTKDLREANAIEDLKTSGKAASGNLANSLQMRMYALSEKIERKIPSWVHVDHLRYLKGGPEWTRFALEPTNEWISQIMFPIERAITIIEAVREGKAVMTPADPSDYNWVCSEKWCGYCRTCNFWSGR
jgi:hypothetical protein